MKSQINAGVTPSIKDQNLSQAFKKYNQIQSGFTVNLEGTPRTTTEIREVERSSKILQKLFGSKKVPVTQTEYVNETSYLEAELVSLIENVKNKVIQDNIDEVET